MKHSETNFAALEVGAYFIKRNSITFWISGLYKKTSAETDQSNCVRIYKLKQNNNATFEEAENGETIEPSQRVIRVNI